MPLKIFGNDFVVCEKCLLQYIFNAIIKTLQYPADTG